MKKMTTLLGGLMAGALFAFPAPAEMIHLMARKGDVEKVLAEIEKGVPVDLPSTLNTTVPGVSPLSVASQFGRTDVVIALLEKGADPDFNRPAEVMEGDNDVLGAPIHEAARNGHAEIVQLLIDAGANPTLEDPGLGTPLHQARRWDHAEAAGILLANGAEESVQAPSIEPLLASADAANGQKLANGCGLCHSLETGSAEIITGPSLWGIVGRKIGEVDAFEYSNVMASRGGTWDYDALNSLLASPTAFMPGTKMEISGVSTPGARADLIVYLRTLSDDPFPLP
jgi:cytochrome c